MLLQLRQLAGLIRRSSTPHTHRRASDSGPAISQRKTPSNTPSRFPRTTPLQRQPLQVSSGNRSNPTTPYTVRALKRRRLTPGYERRKSGKMQRETPRDALRNLSKRGPFPEQVLEMTGLIDWRCSSGEDKRTPQTVPARGADVKPDQD